MTSSASRSAAWRPSARCDSRKAKRRGRASRTSSRRCGTRMKPFPFPKTSPDRSGRRSTTCGTEQGVNGPVHRLHRRRAADRPRREHLRKPAVVVEGKGAARRAGHAGNPGIAGIGDRKRRPRRLTPACLQRNRAGTSVESSHRGGILVRRSSPGVAGGAATLSRRCSRKW